MEFDLSKIYLQFKEDIKLACTFILHLLEGGPGQTGYGLTSLVSMLLGVVGDRAYIEGVHHSNIAKILGSCLYQVYKQSEQIFATLKEA